MNDSDSETSSGRVRNLLSHLAQPTADWAYSRDERRPSVLLMLMSVLLFLLAAVALVSVGIASGIAPGGLFLVELALIALSGVIVAVLMYQVRQHLLAPLRQLYGWALQMCDGDLSARITPPREGRFVKLSFHVNRLSEALDRLANQMDDMVWEQTERLHDKNQSLELLYDIVAAMHGAEASDEVLVDTTRRLLSLTGTERAVGRTLADDGSMVLVSRVGFVDRPGDFEISPIRTIPKGVRVVASHEPPDQQISVPLRYQDQALGLIELWGTLNEPLGEETIKLLTNVGQHLGMVIAKASLDQKAHDLALVNERTALAHELHDSLAQSVAALRFKVNNLSDSMHRADALASQRDLRKIDAGIEAVNTEIRDLIANFRVPIDERGLLALIEEIVSRFEHESAMTVYLHSEGKIPTLSPVAEVQLLGIVREGLANARKHSDAKLIRILLQARNDGGYRLLIEDDGIGFDRTSNIAQSGQHIGLSIMQDRAQRLGGTLKIESEPGEGTRLELILESVSSTPNRLVTVN